MGSGSFPRYLLPLSEEMGTLIRSQGRERANLAIEQLKMEDALYTARYTQALSSTQTIYDQLGDDTFTQAEQLLTATVLSYRTNEVSRLKSQYDKEVKKKPTDLTSLGAMLAGEPDKSTQEGGKRKRPRSRSGSRGRQGNSSSTSSSNNPRRQQGNSRDRPPMAQQQTQPGGQRGGGRGRGSGRGNTRGRGRATYSPRNNRGGLVNINDLAKFFGSR